MDSESERNESERNKSEMKLEITAFMFLNIFFLFLAVTKPLDTGDSFHI